MPWSQTPIRIDKVDQIRIDAHLHPEFYELLRDLLRSYNQSNLSSWGNSSLSPQTQFERGEESSWVRRLDLAGKIVSTFSGLAVIVFVVLLWSGRAALGSVSVKNLLSIFSFTLIGGFISVGGVKMFSINANLPVRVSAFSRSLARQADVHSST
jgi:hypothetical protein